MKSFIRYVLASLHFLWRAWLALLALPWRVAAWLFRTGQPEVPRADAPGRDNAQSEFRAEDQPGIQAEARAEARAETGAEVSRPEPGDGAIAASAADAGPADAAAPTQPAAGREEPDAMPPARESLPGFVTAPRMPAPALVKVRRGAGEFAEGVFRADAGQRDYKLYIPDGKPSGPLPLLVMLHGCKQDPDDFAAGTRMNELAQQQQVLVLYPAQTKAANPYACWNWFSKRDQERDAGEPAIIAGMVREVMERHGGDPARVFVAGMSAGGAMAAILAHTYPDLLAAAGIHSGLPYRAAQDVIGALGVMKRGATSRAAPTVRPRGAAPDARARKLVPLIAFHGDHDKTVHPINGERVVEQALESARAARPHDLGHTVVKPGRVPGGHAYTQTIHTDRVGHVHAEHWLVQGSGHAWSGGDSAGSFTDPLGPDASAQMLRFFLERPRA